MILTGNAGFTKGGWRSLNGQFYELAALAGRYVFAALMVLIVLRAARITFVDARRAALLRRMSPETGICGELVVTRGGDKARQGMRYPVIREGMIGASRRADIRIRHRSVRRRHAYFQMFEDGLSVRSHAGAFLGDGRGRPARELMLGDGDSLTIGAVRLLLVLSAAPEPPAHRPRREEAFTGGVGGADALFETSGAPEPPARRKSPRRRADRDPDDLF